MEIISDFNLKKYNTFGIDVITKGYAQFKNESELLEILGNEEYKMLPKLVLGGGSNILFTKDFDGLVLHNQIKGIEIIGQNDTSVYIRAGAGELWHDLVLYTVTRGFGGLENLSLIPGSVGAAPIQNIGAYGVELKDCMESLEAFHITTGDKAVFTNQDCLFDYRDSIFKQHFKGKFIITNVIFKLEKNPHLNISYGAITDTLKEMNVFKPTVKDVSDAVIHIRKSKLPDPAVIGNAGSFFKNPEIPEKQFENLKLQYPTIPFFPCEPGKVKVPAGWLNEQCGWKGKVVGNAGVHKHQALVLINCGDASGDEIKNLSLEIKRSVSEKFGIELETEVNIL